MLLRQHLIYFFSRILLASLRTVLQNNIAPTLNRNDSSFIGATQSYVHVT